MTSVRKPLDCRIGFTSKIDVVDQGCGKKKRKIDHVGGRGFLTEINLESTRRQLRYKVQHFIPVGYFDYASADGSGIKSIKGVKGVHFDWGNEFKPESPVKTTQFTLGQTVNSFILVSKIDRTRERDGEAQFNSIQFNQIKSNCKFELTQYRTPSMSSRFHLKKWTCGDTE